ncbi:MAG: bifunctional folylpolyglutamate synthase/dihydrofolate synthase, partial [Gammaproteobacteria bacterium]|nr:bifunctional folylpolyglutamate synthase/dihydrofolate synthase [Gammaproteobacteria bacterium]
MTSLESWLAYIEELHPENIELGLERVAQVHARLPSAASTAKVLTVAGTNGKGSTVECLLQCLLTQGVTVAAYTSPHLRQFNERIRINGRTATDAAIVAAFAAVEAQRDGIELTYFEFATLVAFEVFHTQQVDVWILEVGMGGRLDAVNIIDADIAIITSIGIDHCAWLGDTREEIAREKAGIMRIDAPVICADPDPPAAISECAVSAGSKLIQLGMDYHYSTGAEHWLWEGQWEARAGLTLPGHAHLDNLAGALAALELLGWLPDVTTLNRVFDNWKLSGRLQVVPGAVEWWLDVAHNEGSVRALVRALTHNPE